MWQSVKSFLLAGSFFGAFMAAFFSFQYGAFIGIPSGLGSGLLFGVFIAAFGIYQARRFKGQCPLTDGETLLKEGPANHFVRAEGVGGWLYLTSARLFYRSHKINIQNHELTIPLADISKATTALTAGIIPNGLHVETNGRTERFVVHGSRSWVEAIELAKPR